MQASMLIKVTCSKSTTIVHLAPEKFRRLNLVKILLNNIRGKSSITPCKTKVWDIKSIQVINETY